VTRWTNFGSGTEVTVLSC
uniref:Uncharacterized protein n=1 Tax=Sarcophilus harrisii TaxID=9305 RepID=A0A7N4PQT1_SARHA